MEQEHPASDVWRLLLQKSRSRFRQFSKSGIRLCQLLRWMCLADECFLRARQYRKWDLQERQRVKSWPRLHASRPIAKTDECEDGIVEPSPSDARRRSSSTICSMFSPQNVRSMCPSICRRAKDVWPGVCRRVKDVRPGVRRRAKDVWPDVCRRVKDVCPGICLFIGKNGYQHPYRY